MGAHGRHFPLLPLLALALLAAASAAVLEQPQPPLPGYGKEYRPFGNFNGIPIAPRPSPWIRAAEIQRADADVFPGERPRPAFPDPQAAPVFLQRSGPQYPMLPAVDAVYQRMGPPPLVPAPYSRGNNRDRVPQTFQHSKLLIDHLPELRQPQQQQPEQQTAFRSGNNGDRSPQTFQHSMLLIDHPPEMRLPQPQQTEQQAAFRSGDQEPQTDEHSMVMMDQAPAQILPQQGQPDQQPIARNDDSAAGERMQYQRSTLQLDQTAGEGAQQPAVSGEPMAAGSPAEESVQVQGPADQQASAQESGVAAAQVTQQDSSVPQGPVFMPYQQGPRPFGVVFQSNEPYPGLSPPPAYQLEQVAWGAQPMQVPVYTNPFRDQPPQQEQQPGGPAVVENPRPVAYYPEGYQPFLNQRQDYEASRVGFGPRPFVEDRSGTVPRPPGGVAPFPMPSSYIPETPLEETKQDEVVPDKTEQSESHETEKSKDDGSEEDDDEAGDEIENKVKALKDAVDVEEEVVPALVVFLRKKGHKAFHDKDSVAIPGKEDRFRRSPGIGGGSSSHSSSSSSSSSGPVYFGDGGSGSYSSSSSQSSSSSGGGAPLGHGASGPGLGGGGAFYGGGHVTPSGYGVSGGGGGGYGNNGYGNTGYGNTGYGNTGHGNAGYGNSGYGGGAVGGGGGGYGGGYGGGVGPSGGGGGSYGGGGCSTCDDSNVLLNRFGEVDGSSGPFTVGGSGASKGQGVHSSASSSIDSTGKVTYQVSAGKH